MSSSALFASLAFCVLTAPAFAQHIVVDATPSHATNSFSPRKAMGAGVDGVSTGTVDRVYTAANIPQMLSAGFGPLTYRLYTELSVQHWHWNPQGSFSSPRKQGYWTSSTSSAQPIAHSFGYNLPRSGFTTDQGSNAGYSRLDDGDPTTFWKSNPYLSSHYTHEDDVQHPQWLIVDLGGKKPVNAIQVNWANPYALQYQVQYWTGDDAIFDQANGQWVTFPSGTITHGSGGNVILTLATEPVSVEYVRIWMTAPSKTCVETPPADPRDCLGYAINEIGLGQMDSSGHFDDLINHQPNQTQTLTYCSSVDPWHTSADKNAGEEQPGLDLVFTSGLTNAIPPIIPVTMLYGIPQDSANEVRYLESRGYTIGYVEMGEEADGQYILPEDYAALYLQWADALHAVDPNLKLGGPVLQSDAEVTVWPDASGNTSWLNRFLNYLKSHGRLNDLAFMSYEHYPYNPCSITWKDLLGEPAYTRQSLQTWANDGLPSTIPVFVTESNVTYDFQEQQVGLFGALWFSDFTGVFFAAGGKQVYFYEYEPLPLYSASDCNSWGNFGMFKATNASYIVGYTSQYFSAQLLTQQWAEPIDATHYVYNASSDITALNGDTLVTAYALLRPDGKWSLLLINKDKVHAQSIAVAFRNANNNSNHYFHGSVTQVTFGEQEYAWHAASAHGFPSPDGPATTSTVPGGSGAQYNLPAGSITVLRGDVQ